MFLAGSHVLWKKYNFSFIYRLCHDFKSSLIFDLLCHFCMNFVGVALLSLSVRLFSMVARIAMLLYGLERLIRPLAVFKGNIGNRKFDITQNFVDIWAVFYVKMYCWNIFERFITFLRHF